MKLIDRDRNSISLQMSPEELTILNNALNEVCNGLDIEEFSTRMGVELDEAQSLLKQIGDALDEDRAR